MSNDKTIGEIFDTLTGMQKEEIYMIIGNLFGGHISLNNAIRSFELRDDLNDDQKKVITIIFKTAMNDYKWRDV